MALIAAKPLVDAFAERSRVVSLDIGTLWSSLMLVVGAYWILKQRSLSWAQVLLLLSILGLSLGSFIAAVASRNQVDQIVVEGLRLVTGLVPAAILLGVPNRGRNSQFGRLLQVFILGIAIHSVVAVLQYLGQVPSTYFQAGQPRPSGLYFHPVSLGILVNVSLLLLVLANSRKWIRLPMATLLSAVLLAIGVLSTHRAGLVVAVLILFSWPLIRIAVESKSFRINTLWTLGIGTAIVVGVAGLYVLPQGRAFVTEAIDGVVSVIGKEDLDPTSDGFLRSRGQLWSGAIDQVAMGSWAQRMFGYGRQIVDPHSDYLRAILVHGLAGAMLLALGLGAIVLGFVAKADRLGRLFIGLLVASTMAYALTTKPTTYTFYMWAVTALAWLAAGSWHLERDSREGRRSCLS